jgi:choice-of-anchor C domain-containing protein
MSRVCCVLGVLTIAAFAPVAGATKAAAASNIVVNGDFELPDGGGATITNTPPTGWTNSFGNTDIVGPDTWDAASGKQSVDLNGDQQGGLYQDLTTTPSQAYVLRFAYAGNFYGSPTVKTFTVTFGGTSFALSFDTTNSSQHSMGWIYAQYNVTASATTTRLEFDSTTMNVPHGPAIDDVSVIPALGTAVAETPLTLLLAPIGAATGGLTWMVSRRRSSRGAAAKTS